MTARRADDLHVFSIPLRTRFRGITVREGVLLRGCDDDGEPSACAVAIAGAGHVAAVAAHLCSDPRGPGGSDGRSLLLAALAWVRKTPARIDLAR